jgi:aspartyl-tRNA synthetase
LQGKRISNSRIKPKGDVAAQATRGGAGGLAFLRVVDGSLDGAKALRDALSAEQKAAIIQACSAEEDDLLLIAAGSAGIVNKYACPRLSRKASLDGLVFNGHVLSLAFVHSFDFKVFKPACSTAYKRLSVQVIGLCSPVFGTRAGID